MSDGISELRQFSTNLGRVAGSALQDVDDVLKKGVQNMKNELQSDVSQSSFHGMAGSITYESYYFPGRVRWVVGPDKSRRGGALGNIYYFGTSRGGGTGDIDKPLRSEEPRTMSALDALAARWAGQL